MDTTGNKLSDFGLEYLSYQERDSEYSTNNADELRGRMIKGEYKGDCGAASYGDAIAAYGWQQRL